MCYWNVLYSLFKLISLFALLLFNICYRMPPLILDIYEFYIMLPSKNEDVIITFNILYTRVSNWQLPYHLR